MEFQLKALLLGHKNLRTTQYYAKVLDRKVSDGMKVLKDKFSFSKTQNHKVNMNG